MPEEKQIQDVTAQRDVVMGSQTNINYFIQVPGFQTPPKLEDLRNAYERHLQRTYHALDFKGIPQLQTISRDLSLEDVYVPLLARPEMPAGETWERRLAGRHLKGDELPDGVLEMATKPEASVPVPVEKALGKHSRVVVIGDPGSGKTTLVKYLALRLAAEADAPLPILVPLNAYAEALRHEDINLQIFLPSYFAGLASDVANLRPLFDAALGNGQAVVLLDGLDEVQTENRGYLVHKIESFTSAAVEAGNKVLVTSRIVGYKEAPLNAQHWALHTLLDFDRQAIVDFASRWCLAFEKSTLGDTPEAEAQAAVEERSLLEAIDTSPGVAQLASNPLLLTILALIKRQGVSLPNRRVRLYELYLETLITAWGKARALDKRPVGPPLDYYETVAVLGPLALWLRQENPTAGLVSEEDLHSWLTDHFQGEEWGYKRGEARQKATAFMKSVRKYSNLLVERGKGRYGFMHLTFEEALAARGLEKLGQEDLEQSLGLLKAHLADPGWRETILLAVGVWGLVRENRIAAGKAVQTILETECTGEYAGQHILIAGACLEDVGAQGIGRLVAGKVQEALLAAVIDRALPPDVQRDAGFCLGRIGWVPEDLDQMIAIPAGKFLYGDDQQKVEIHQPFEIAKYSVTNSQFKQFVDAGGYDAKSMWSEEGWAWRTGEYDSTAPDYLQSWLEGRPAEKRNLPFYWHDRRWNTPLTPVVGVSWFEAEAYCSWLTQELGKPIRLPTEEEWERAARGTTGRTYPWGEKYDRDYVNCAEFWAGVESLENSDDWRKWLESDSYKKASTTIIGQFPAGKTGSGVSDLGGNIFEWTDSWYSKTERVLRGGSWDLIRWDVRCASRGRSSPDDFSDSIGFRVVSPG
jgi:formylglycine-generating enzyme required for sulfatase activity